MWTAPTSHPRQSSMSPSVIHEADDDDDDDPAVAAADSSRTGELEERVERLGGNDSCFSRPVWCGAVRRLRNAHDVAIGSGYGPKE